MNDGNSPNSGDAPNEVPTVALNGISDLHKIAGGGSGIVYRGYQQALDRYVAIKVLHSAWDAQVRHRFNQERRAMGRLSGHTSTVPILESGATDDGRPYVLMPYYQLGSLFGLMEKRGPLPWREATFLVQPLAETVGDCHQQNIVHRDIKPSNVMLSHHLRPYLSDFGIATFADEPQTKTGLAYSPSYSPPEAFVANTCEPTVDTYGLGATLWALIAGRQPHTKPGESVNPETAFERAQAGPPPPASNDIPHLLSQFIARSLDPDPKKRPANGEAFAAELRQCLRRCADKGADKQTERRGFAGLAARSRSSSQPWSRPNPATLALVALASLGATIILLTIWGVIF